MLRTRRGEESAAGVPSSSPRRALAALCVTEIVSYGVIYYAFPVLATQITAGTGWSRTAVTAAYSAGSLAGAVAGILAGRLLHHRGPRVVMTAGGVLGAASVAGIATAPSYGWFLAAWLAAGVASAGLYYPPAFAALTVWYGPRRVQALTTLTLAAGFASTIFAPLTSALSGQAGWRGTYLILAAVLAAITIPVHALGLLPGPAALLVLASVIAGAVRGVFTLTEATLVADQWGTERYAVINGVFNAPVTAAGAVAPAIGAGVAAATGSYPLMFAVLAAVAAAGAILAGTAPSPARSG
jgi:Major Facilitator Superfamily